MLSKVKYGKIGKIINFLVSLIYNINNRHTNSTRNGI